MAPKKQTPTDPYADMPDTSVSGSDPYADMPDSAVDSLTANPKGQGTYKMLAPAGSNIKSGIMVPYGNVRNALTQGFGFDPQSGDDTRYSHNLFTELNGKGQAPKADSNDEDSVNKYGVLPTPAAGTREWYKRQAIQKAHATIDSLPTIGMIGGAVAGSPGLITGVGGAAAGAVLGEDLRQSLNQHFFGEHLTPKQTAQRLAVQGAIGVGTELGSRAFAYPFSAMGKYLGYTADESAKAGIPLLGSEARGEAPSWSEEVLKGNILSKNIMKKFRENQNKESAAAVDKLMDSISNFKGTPEELGIKVQEGLSDSEKAFRAEQNILYKAIDDITEKPIGPPTSVNIPLYKDGKVVLDKAGKPVTQTIVQPNLRVMPSMVELKKFAQEKLDEINQPPYFLPKDAAEQSRNAFDTILNNPDKVSFKRMRDMRSVLSSQVRTLDEAMGGGKLGLAKKVETLTDQSIEDAAKNSGIPNLAKRWREANDVTAETHRMFEQKLVDKAVESENPEFIASLLGGKTIGLQQTRDLFKALPEKVYDPVRRGLLNDAVTKATEPRTGAFNEGKFATYIDRLGDEKGKIIFGQNWKNIKELVDIIGKINGPVGLAGGGGAALQNIGIVKRLATVAVSLPASAIALGAGTGHLEAGLMGAGILGAADAAGLAGTLAGARTVAWAMVNPAKATAMLKVARAIARGLPYTPAVGYHLTKEMSPKQSENIRGFVNRSAHDLITPKPATPAPAAPSGGQAYNHLAVNPKTGHRIASADGKQWYDAQTGQQVA
jgi:hypothetical protein